MTENTEAGSMVAPPQELVTAGFLRRFVAAIVDFFVFAPIWAAIGLPAELKGEGYVGAEMTWWGMGLLYGAWLAYGIVMLGRYGWTVGMRALKVRVSRGNGAAIGFECAALRTLVYFFPQFVAMLLAWAGWGLVSASISAAWGVCLLWLIVDERHQGYHDKIANTFVVCGVEPAPEVAAPAVATLPASQRLRVGKWAVFVVLSLLASWRLGLEVAAYRAESQLEAMLAELRAEGKPIRAADLAPPPVPDSENAALVYDKAFQKLQLVGAEETVFSRVVSNWQRGLPLGHGITPEKLEILRTGRSPEKFPPEPAGDKALVLAPPGMKKGKWMKAPTPPPAKMKSVWKGKVPPPPEWGLMSVDPTAKVERQPGEPTDAQVLAALKKTLDRNRGALALIHEAAGMEKCRFDIEWVQWPNTLFPQFPQLRKFARLLTLEAMVLCEEGDADAALRVATDIFDVSNPLRDTPILIGLLVRKLIAIMGVSTAERILYDSRPSPAACQAAEARLAKCDFRGALARALEGERASCLDIFEAVRKAADPMGVIDGFVEGSGAWPPEETPHPHSGSRKWWFCSEELFYLRLMHAQIRRAKLPFFEQDSPILDEVRELEALLDKRSLFPPRILSLILGPVFTRTRETIAATEAGIGMCRIALLLKVYRAEHGSYPASLDELERFIGKRLPLDPCSGESFHYQPKGRGFLLYSVGLNRVDDGGKVMGEVGKEYPIPRMDSREGGDLVWVCKE